MITINANIENNILIYNIQDCLYYLWVISSRNSCNTYKYIYEGISCNETSPYLITDENEVFLLNENFIYISYEMLDNVVSKSQLFNINDINLGTGVYDLSIYKTNSSTNFNINDDLIYQDKIRVFNPNNFCYNMPYIMNENSYILETHNNIKILYNE